MLGAICRDTSCLIFKRFEDLKLGVNAITPLIGNIIIQLAIVLVDDIDFCASEADFNRKMQLIIGMCARLCEVIEGKMQE